MLKIGDKIKHTKAKDVVIHTTQNCEYFNRKLLGTTEHSILSRTDMILI
jgi:hypothetical protein